MIPNVGGLDRLLRLLVGVTLLGCGIAFNTWWGLIGIVPLTTGLFRFCPAYLPFRFTTCRPPRSPDERRTP